MPGRQQHAGQQRHPPLIELLGERRRGDAGAIVDQRIAGKKTGGMGVRTHAAMDDVELRHPAVAQSEKLANFAGIALRRVGGRHLALDAMHICRADLRRDDQILVGELIIAGRIGGRNAALVHEEQVHAIPCERGGGHLLKEQLGRASAGDGKRCLAASRDSGVQPAKNIFRARVGRRLRIGTDLMNAHCSMGCANCTADARVRSKTGSCRTILNSSRISM